MTRGAATGSPPGRRPSSASRAGCSTSSGRPRPVLSTAGDAGRPDRRRRSCSSPPTWSRRCGSAPAASGWPRPRWGCGVRVFCVDVSAHPKTRGAPRHVRAVQRRGRGGQPQREAREGCMSVPDLTGDVKRATRVVVRGQLPGTGEEVTVDRRRLRGPGAAARDRPLRRAAVPRPGRRRARDPPAQDLPVTRLDARPAPPYPNRQRKPP